MQGFLLLDKRTLLNHIPRVTDLRQSLKQVRLLLDHLERKASACPGLFPLRSRLEFLNLASDQQLNRFVSLEDISRLSFPELRDLALFLENLRQNPALGQQLLACSLLRHKTVTLKTHKAGDSAREEWLGLVLAILEEASETACQKKRLESA